MVKLALLKNEAHNRRVRNVIMNGGNTINVYEPSGDDVTAILDLQERWATVQEGTVEISGEEVVRVLFPMLTDIEGIEEMTDEEIREVVENPSLAFIQVNSEIHTIIAEIFKTLVLSQRRALIESDFKVESYRTNKETFDRALAIAAKETGSTDLLNKIDAELEEKEKALNEELAKAENQNIVNINKIKSETEERKKKYQDIVAKYRASFEDLQINTDEEGQSNQSEDTLKTSTSSKSSTPSKPKTRKPKAKSNKETE